jgi:hypothetical protein
MNSMEIAYGNETYVETRAHTYLYKIIKKKQQQQQQPKQTKKTERNN